MKAYSIPYNVEEKGDYYVYNNVRYYQRSNFYVFSYKANLTLYNLYRVRLSSSSLNDLEIVDSGRVVGDL